MPEHPPSPKNPNRFHIDVRSELQVGDMEWAILLSRINMLLAQHRMPHVTANLEEYPKASKP